jgi:protein-tyrosine phosphatase
MTTKPHTMCDCGDEHDVDCFFYDEWYDQNIPNSAFTSQLPDMNRLPIVSTTGELSKSSFLWTSHCRHNQSPFVLPSGSTVYASAWRDVPMKRTPPDVGVYFDTSWFPADCFAYAVGWQDYGLPTISDLDVARTARAVLNHLDYGDRVEVGCLGAHGRTGTFLALLTIMDSLDTSGAYGAKRAVQYVRDNHCYEAIETKGQETWLRRMSGKLRRGDI